MANKLKVNYYLLAIICGGFLARLFRLGRESLWYDETVSAFLAGQPIPALMAHTARDIHPPAYYLLLHGWTLLAGETEFALAFFSLVFGLALIPLTYRLARELVRRPGPAIWAAGFVAFSPYNVWYAQEVRMYTLGAFLGLAATWCVVKTGQNSRSALWFWTGYILLAAAGLYTLYYFAFLLITINLFFLGRSVVQKNWSHLRSLLIAGGLIAVVYLPWLPIAWRQAANPPVPPWRTPPDFAALILESWSALSLGQSVEPGQVWPFLFLTLILFILGLVSLYKSPLSSGPVSPRIDREPETGDHESRPVKRAAPRPLASSPDSQWPVTNYQTPLFLCLYTFGPLLLIVLFSLFTPLYHVRYIFTYSPAFYIILGAGVVWLGRHWGREIALGSVILLLAASFFSIYQLHFHPRYRADDYRAAVAFIQDRWRPGDIILANAGYIYPAFLYYAGWPALERTRLTPYQQPIGRDRPFLLQAGTVDGPPQLGWGDPRSDFYAMTAAETITALEHLSDDYTRLWLLRAYDTVTDPQGLIRRWLAENTIPLEDQPFSGQSNIRVQGFLLDRQPPLGGEPVYFEDGLALAGWSLPSRPWQAGETIHLDLGWLTTAPPGVDYKMSLKLWSESGQLAHQGRDTWPVGRLYRATAWPLNRPVYQPARLTLPPDLPAGRYWLDVELYHPETGLPLPRLDGQAPVVTLGPVVVQPF